ncbi:MAG: DUF2085 domain-containing protein [Clostridia bacterium]|nr:DUF2085 domain-containing protein [Clostridia bacterium]
METVNKKSDSRWIKMMQFGTRMGCHQMSDRSFFIHGYQFPVCARCTGVIIGEILALIAFLFPFDIPFVYSLMLLIPMGIDWGLQYLKICMSDNIRRLLTGILGGFALTNIYWEIILFVYQLIVKLVANI